MPARARPCELSRGEKGEPNAVPLADLTARPFTGELCAGQASATAGALTYPLRFSPRVP